MNLSFDEETHRYMVDGEPAVSVSRLVTQVTGKSFAGIDPEILEAARIRGESIHSEVEHNNCLSSEAQWISTEVDIPECQFEVKVGGSLHGLVIAGRTDVVDERNKTVFDIKTGSSKDLLGWTIQLNLYRELLIQTTGFEARNLAVLWTPKKGNYKIVEIQILSEFQIKELIDAYKYQGYLDKTFLEKAKIIKIVIEAKGKPEEIESILWHLKAMSIENAILEREEL